MSKAGDDLKKMVAPLLIQQGPPTEKALRELIDQLRKLPMCQVDDAEADAIFRELEERFGVVIKLITHS